MTEQRFEQLADRIADAVAERVLERLAAADVAGQADAPGEMLTVREVAERTGRSHDWVRQHAAELGVERIGEGVKPRLLFPRARIEALLSGERNGEPTPEAEHGVPHTPRNRRRPPSAEVPLLRYDGYEG